MSNPVWYKFYDSIKPKLDYPDGSIFDAVEDGASTRLDKLAYIYFGAKHTYRQFLNEVDECAKSFKVLGLTKGDCVTICMPNTPVGIISFYALNKMGITANMVHPLSSESELEYYINLSESKSIVCIDIAVNKVINIFSTTNLKNIICVSASDFMPVYMKVLYKMMKGRKIKLKQHDKIIQWGDFLKLSGNCKSSIYKKQSKDDVAVILYSGGTSGYPKGIELTNLNFNAVALQSLEACNTLNEGDSILSVMPIFHGFGLGIGIHAFMLLGGPCILIPQFSIATFGDLLKKYKPNVVAGVPTLYEALLKNKKLENCDLSFLKCAVSGGDSLSVELKKKIDSFLSEHNSKAKVREGYGLTECVTGSCLAPLNYCKEGSIGIPYPDMYYKIVKHNTDEELPANSEGEIVITGPTLMKGYLKDKEETDLAIRMHNDGQRWLHTGDLGYMDNDGFVYFKSRIKRLIISSGYCIYPQYIENVIDSHPDVLMSCIIGIPHQYKKEVAKAFVVLKNSTANRTEAIASIKKHCEEKLVKYSWPFEYEIIDELPKTLVGKIAYTKLEG